MAHHIVTAAGADRTPPELLAPADVPDPFWRHWWCQMQMLGWVYSRNPDVVRAAVPTEYFGSTLTRNNLRNLGRDGACYPHFADAEDAAIEAQQAGRLTAFGVANGEGERKKIPSRLWVDLVFRYEPNCAGPKDLLRKGVTCWYDLRFPRKQVLAVWPPAPAESESPSTLPSDLASRSGAGLATKRWSEAKQKREPVLDEAESVARERWKDCDDDHAKMTSWLQSYTPDDKTLPFVDETLTKPVRERMVKVARELRKPVKGEKKSPG